jgi:hypothetical protein
MSQREKIWVTFRLSPVSRYLETNMNLRPPLLSLTATLAFASLAFGQTVPIVINPDDAGETIWGPDKPDQREAWSVALHR